jgi:hypothetical protein
MGRVFPFAVEDEAARASYAAWSNLKKAFLFFNWKKLTLWRQ